MQDKDLFREHYSLLLSRRLLQKKSVSDDLEKFGGSPRLPCSRAQPNDFSRLAYRPSPFLRLHSTGSPSLSLSYSKYCSRVLCVLEDASFCICDVSVCPASFPCLQCCRLPCIVPCPTQASSA